MAFDDVIGQLPNLPKKLRYPFVVEFLVERHLLAQLANKDGLAETDDYKRRLAAYQAKALRDSYPRPEDRAAGHGRGNPQGL
jgi:peptidyl-prolyl cis-trans isomerase C